MTDRYLLSPFFLDEALPELEKLAGEGWRVCRPEMPESILQDRVSALHLPFADLVADTIAAGERPIALVGDCCASIPVFAGLQRAGVEPVLVWLDAHGDFNTWDTTPSGFLGGMPLAMLVGRGDPTLMDTVLMDTVLMDTVTRRPLAEDRVVLTDARDLDPGERLALEESAVTHLRDPRQLLTHAMPDGPLWVHFDIDIVDPIDAPAVLYPAPGGLRAGDLEHVFGQLAAGHEIAAVSVSTWNPKLDGEDRTRNVCLNLLQALLGTEI